MADQDLQKTPALDVFELPGSGNKVVDPSKLPEKTLAAFNNFMMGKTAPHRVYVYSHDYDRFCTLVRKGNIKIYNRKKNCYTQLPRTKCEEL